MAKNSKFLVKKTVRVVGGLPQRGEATTSDQYAIHKAAKQASLKARRRKKGTKESH